MREKKRSGEKRELSGKKYEGNDEILVQTSTKLPLTAMEEVEALASEHELKISPALRLMVLRGLAAYHRDGLLEEPAANAQSEE